MKKIIVQFNAIIFASGLMAYCQTGAALSATPNEATRAQVQTAYGNLPLVFMENHGQVDTRAAFYEQAMDHSAFFYREGIRMRFHGSDASATIDMFPVGANQHSEIIGEQRLQTQVNYLLGHDSREWKTHVPAYGAVRYKEIYPGVDLKLYGNNRQLEYDFILQPDADPTVIQMAVQGIQGARILANGDLELAIGDKKMISKRPVIYQTINGQRIDISGQYKLLAQNDAQQHVYGFDIGNYDKSQPLVIDPILSYSTYLGGKRLEIAYAIAVDELGHAYVGGRTQSESTMDVASPGKLPDFPVTAGALQTHHADIGVPVPDGVISKFNLDGSGMVYSTYLGGGSDAQYNKPTEAGAKPFNQSGGDIITGIAVNRAGEVYVTGNTSSARFPVTAGVYQAALNVGKCHGVLPVCADAFVAKLNRDGSALLYSTYLGGSATEYATAIAVDATGNAYITGGTASDNYPTTTNAAQPGRGSKCPPPVEDGSCTDAFVAKLNHNGSALLYSTFLGGSELDQAKDIALDSRANFYVVGTTRSADFPTSQHAYKRLRGNGTSTAFVSKFNNTGSLAYSTYMGGNDGEDEGNGIAVDQQGHAYVVGFTRASDFPHTPGVFGSVRHSGVADAFVSQLNTDGSSLIYSTLLGGTKPGAGTSGPPYTYGYDITLDAVGNAYIVGVTSAADFPLVNATQPAIAYPGTFIAKINPTASTLLFSTHHKGSSGMALAVDTMGSIYFAGNTTTETMPVMHPLQPVNSGGGDAFVAKINLEGPATKRVSLNNGGAQANHHSNSASISANGRYIAFASNATNLVSHDSNGKSDVFVRDRLNNKTIRMSVGKGGVQGNHESYHPAISADGRHVAFISEASNLAPNHTKGTWGIFVRDRDPDNNGIFDEANAVTRRIGTGVSSAKYTGRDYPPSISGNGRYVAFISTASKLVAGDTNGVADIFMYDLQLGKLTRLNVGSQPNGTAWEVVLNFDGRYAAFSTVANNLVANDNNDTADVFFHDRDPDGNGIYDEGNNITTLISATANGATGNYMSYAPSISANGQVVAFTSYAWNLVEQDTNGVADVFIHTRPMTSQPGMIKRITAKGGVQGNAPSFPASVNEDGHFIAFASDASNLVANDVNRTADIFLYSVPDDSIEHVSVDTRGVQANSANAGNVISMDGHAIAFSTVATNLTDKDTNAVADVVVRIR